MTLFASMLCMATFLSTLPARGATMDAVRAAIRTAISIHAPREGSDHRHSERQKIRQYFYPRSPRGERLPGSYTTEDVQAFLSTLPARGATTHLASSGAAWFISIHAPREGSDVVRLNAFSPLLLFLSTLPARGATPYRSPLGARLIYFYPRSPRGERPEVPPLHTPGALFLSTLPARGATCGSPGSFPHS